MRMLLLFAAMGLAGCVTSTTGNPNTETNLAEAARTNTSLAVEYARSGNLDLAMEKAKRALAQDDSYAPAHSTIALLYAQRGEEDQASRHYRRAISLDSKDLFTRNNFAIFLCERGHTEDALSMMESVARNKDYNAPDAALINAGLCASRANLPDRAERYFREALTARPDNPEAMVQLAKLAAQKQDWLKVRAFIQRRNQIAKPSALSLDLAMRAERGLGDFAEADRLSRQLQQDFP